MSIPSISIITTMWNPDIKSFERVLKSIQSQNYPKKQVDHIIFDGGSTNGATILAKRYGCKVTVRPDLLNLAQVRQSLAIKKAKGDLVLILEADNILTSNNWLAEMVQPFLENRKIFCTFSAYCGYDRKLSATTRYMAFFGTCDPAFYYLGKCDKIPLLEKTYYKGKILREVQSYWVVRFAKDTLLTMGDNGFMVRRSVLNKVNKNPNAYAHVDAFADLLDLGYDTYGVIKNTIIHVQPPSIFACVKSRYQIKQKFYDGRRGKRKYLVFDWNSRRDKINIAKYIFFTITLVVPVHKSIQGYLKIRDNAWFLHPIFSLLMLFTYGLSEFRWFEKELGSRIS